MNARTALGAGAAAGGLLAVATFALHAPAATAWCDNQDYGGSTQYWDDLDFDDPDGSSCLTDADPTLPFTRTWFVQIEDDYAGWAGAIAGTPLSNVPGDPLYYRDVLQHVVESSVAAWMRDARVPYHLGVSITWAPAGTTFGDNGISTITVNNDCRCDLGTAGSWVEGSGPNCDVNWQGGCPPGGGCSSLTSNSVANGGANGFYRIMRHEIGHCLGLGHATIATGCCNAEHVSFDGPIMGNILTDFPHGEDVEGIQEMIRGDTLNGAHRYGPYVSPPSLLPRRETWIQQGFINSSNGFVNGANNNLGIVSVYLPRIDCKGSGGAHDCALIRAYTENHIRFNVLSMSSAGGTPTLGTTITVNGISTRRPPDVAISHRSDGTDDLAVGIVATQEHSDLMGCVVNGDCALGETCSGGTCAKACTTGSDCDAEETCIASTCSTAFNRPRSSVLMRFSGLSGTPSVTTFELDPSSDDDITFDDPRITYVRSLGTACSPPGSTCVDGFTLAHGRFIAMVVNRARSPKLYISDTRGLWFDPMSEDEVVGVPLFLNRRLHEAFDIACPNHANTDGTAADRRCVVTFDAYNNPDVTANATPMQCTLRIASLSGDATHFETVACSPATGFGGERGYLASLSDYEVLPPSTQRLARSWLISAAISSQLAQFNANTRMSGWTHTGDVLTSPDRFIHITRSIDENSASCAPMNGETAKSYYGGQSQDYCEDGQRILRVGWGAFTTADVPANTCY